MKLGKKEMFPPDETVMYEDLNRAHQRLEEVKETGSDAKYLIASAKFDSIEMSLKKLEAIPANPDEEISFELDKLFPKAKNNDVVVHESGKYQLRFTLIGNENGKNIWKRDWRSITDLSDTVNQKKKELFPDDGISLEFYTKLQSDLEHLCTEQQEDTGETASWLGRSERRGNRIAYIEGLLYRAEISLKKRGVLPKNEKETLDFELDTIAGNMKAREVLEYNGKFYQLIFLPFAKSNSGKSVHVWLREWKEIEKP